ncbi:sororin [Protopterus annectens]|uniref:sororin n=1 Tax=Protopterus annectens TaxID=7888 RepID=UPI001CFAEF20|nr:sororin [Protopterus annectens]
MSAKKRTGSTGRDCRKSNSRQSDSVCPVPRRKSERKSQHDNQESKPPVSAPVKKSITLKKIVPRKTMLCTNSEKENAEGIASHSLSARNSDSSAPCPPNSTLKSQISSPEAVEKAVLSPVLNTSNLEQPDNRDHIMSKKVRRSYTRLEMSLVRSPLSYRGSFSQNDASDSSTPNNSHYRRLSLFGFEKLLTPEVLDEDTPVKSVKSNAIEERQSGTGQEYLSDSLPKDVDGCIPGVVVAKEKKKKRKVLQIAMSDLDEWAAQMNAQFEEAEKFSLIVE